MIIGPFWCELDNSWLRIIMDEDNVYAEMAPRNKENPHLATEWKKKDSQDYWLVHYAQNNDMLLLNGLRLLDGTLYSTDFVKSALTQTLHIKVFGKNGETSSFNINKEKFNPFDGKSVQETTITPFKELPDTIEVQVEEEKQRKEKIQAEQEAQNMQWLVWKKQNHRAKLDVAKISTFNDEENGILFDDFTTELTEFSAANYESVEEYKLALENAISNPEDPINKKIIELASTTHFDRQFNLNPTNSLLIRDELFKRKQAFFLAVLESEYKALRLDLKIESPPVMIAPLKSLNIEEESLAVFQQPGVDPVDPGLQKALMESLKDLNTEEDTEVQQAIAVSLNDSPAQNIELIQAAVLLAVNKYQQWYNNGQEHRGPNGLFSFFRHGKEGQLRAQQLNDNISQIEYEHEAISLLNSLLTDSSTRYHKHSLASFLLDELSSFDNVPWYGLKPDVSSNRYDQQDVIMHLQESYSQSMLPT